MDLYTFILEFREGTYISQKQASSINESIEIWANEINIKEIQYFGDKTKLELIENVPEIITEYLTPIESLSNIWSFAVQLKTGFAIVNVIKTDNEL